MTSGHVEFDDGTSLPFGPLADSGDIPTLVNVHKADVQWIRVHIDTSIGGANPGIGEVVFAYFEE